MTPAQPSGDPVLPAKLVFLIAFLAGAGTMLLEVMAPRIMQPWFGASTFVWTNVIGVILFVMALGYQLGGRLCERPGGLRRIAFTLTMASFLTLAVRFAFQPLAEFLLPAPQALAAAKEARRHLELSSLAAAILLFCPPVFLLASLTPQLIQQVVKSQEAPGRAAGHVFMWGTLGSLVGTFLPTYVLVPTMGTRASLLLAALFLFLPAVLVFMRLRQKRDAVLFSFLMALMVGSHLLSQESLRPALEGETLLAEKESRYQYLRVIRLGAVEDPAVTETRLCLDEGVLEFHSVSCEGRIGTLGKYYDYCALLPTLFDRDDALQVLVLGSGTGTMSRLLCDFWPDRIKDVVDVEIDPGVAGMESWFEEEKDPRVHFVALDARAFLETTRDFYDLILVDAYSRQVDIPFHMATREFFALVKSRLKEGGVAALNVSSRSVDAPLTQALLRSMEAGGFESLRSTWVRYWGNRLIWGGHGDRDLKLAFSPVHDELKGPLRHAVRAQLAARVSSSARLLRDDFAPVELLTRRSLEGDAE